MYKGFKELQPEMSEKLHDRLKEIVKVNQEQTRGNDLGQDGGQTGAADKAGGPNNEDPNSGFADNVVGGNL